MKTFYKKKKTPLKNRKLQVCVTNKTLRAIEADAKKNDESVSDWLRRAIKVALNVSAFVEDFRPSEPPVIRPMLPEMQPTEELKTLCLTPTDLAEF